MAVRLTFGVRRFIAAFISGRASAWNKEKAASLQNKAAMNRRTPKLLQRMQPEPLAFFVDEQQRTVFVLQEFHKLRWSDFELLGRSGDVSVPRVQHIERLGQERREVFVIGIASDLAAVTSRLPQRGGSRFGERGRSHGESNVDAKSRNSHAVVVMLTPPLGRLSLDPRRRVEQHDGRFGLVAVLATRSASPFVTDLALAQQLLDGKLDRMQWDVTRSL